MRGDWIPQDGRTTMDGCNRTNRVSQPIRPTGLLRPLAVRLGFLTATALPMVGCANQPVEASHQTLSPTTTCAELKNNPGTIYLGNNRWASLTAKDGQVITLACSNHDQQPLAKTLIEFFGQDRDQLAGQTVLELTAAINNGQLYENNVLMTSRQANALGLRPTWLPGWTPSRLVFQSATLVDFSTQGLTEAERKTKISLLTDQLWASGLMPQEKSRVNLLIQTEESRPTWLMFRDPKMKHYKDLASLYQQRGEYEKAEQVSLNILKSDHTVTAARPNSYDESVFLVADSRRIRGLQQHDPNLMAASLRILIENNAKLKSLEHGYLARYNHEILNTCRLYLENVAEGNNQLPECEPAKIEEYATNATTRYNSYAPAYSDYFIAVSTMLENARARLATAKTPDEINAAVKRCDEALGTIDRNQNPTFWDHLSRGVRIAATSKQFDGRSFNLYIARANEIKAMASNKLAAVDPARKEEHLTNALQVLTNAVEFARIIKQENILEFHTANKFKERQTYHDIIASYSETLLELYYEKEKKAPGSGKELLLNNNVEAMAIAGDNPLETSYLRAALNLGNLNSQFAYITGSAERFALAADFYSVLSNSQQTATEPKQLTDYHRYLFAIAAIRSAELFVAWPRVKSTREVEAQLLAIDNGLTILTSLSNTPAAAKRNEFFLNAAPITKADLLLAQVDRDPTGPKADRLAKAEELFRGAKTSSESYQALKAEVKLIEIAIRRNEFEELDSQGKKVSTNKASGLIGSGEALLGNLGSTHSLRYPLIMSLSTLYIYRNEPTDADRVIALNSEILGNSHNLTEPFKTYIRTYAALNKGTAQIQKGLNMIEEDSRKNRFTADSTIDLIKAGVSQLVSLEQTLPTIQGLEGQLAWETHSLRAELFQQLAIAYSVLERRFKDEYPMKLYTYVQKAYRECATSPNPNSYERTTRPALLARSFDNPNSGTNRIQNAYDPNNPFPIHPEFANLMTVNPTFAPLRDALQDKAWGNWHRFIAANHLVIDLSPEHKDEIFTERTGYGLFLASYFGDKPLAEQLYVAIEKHAKNQNGLYSWRLNLDGSVDKQESAFDADLYIAYSLTVMGTQPERRQELIDKLWEKTIVERGGRLIIKPSDGAWPEHGDGQVVFNPSYFAPHLIKTIASADQNAAQHNWQKVVDDGYELINSALQQSKNLKSSGPNPIPDQLLCQVVGGNFVLSADNSKKDDGLDAVRVMLEIGRDAIINQDPRAVNFLRELLAKANITSSFNARLQGMNNELAIALYAVAVKGAGDPSHNLNTFTSRLNASFQGDHYGMRTNGADGKDYYKQSLILMAKMLLQ